MRQTVGDNTANHVKAPGVLFRVAALAVLGLLVTCSTPERRYRVLSAFFDGVPDPNAPQIDHSGDSTATPVEDRSKYSVHPPWEQRKCDLCHDVMFSNALKVEKSLLCATCHDVTQLEAVYIHGPAGAGQCDACHHPHRSKNPHLLLELGNNMCGKCHTPETFAALESHRVERGEDCLMCHNPHGSDHPYMIRQSVYDQVIPAAISAVGGLR